jgi:Methyltransferase domain
MAGFLGRVYTAVDRQVREARLGLKYRSNQFEPSIERDWSNVRYNRMAFITAAVARVVRETGDCGYLEIGCRDNMCFDSVPAVRKQGVDPNSGGTMRMFSDDFFKRNTEKFDVVFVDGLHEYEQCQRDTINSLDIMPVGGFVLLHDLIPTDWKVEHTPPISMQEWSGDVWKVAFELSKSKGVEFVIADADHGVGIAMKTEPRVGYADMTSELKDKRFRYFYDHHRELPIVDATAALTFIQQTEYAQAGRHRAR